MARSQELLLIFAIAWGTGLAALGEWAGFSKEAGAFLAGFSLASTHYRDAINARLTGIRDFLLLFFFIDLGAKLDFSTLGGEIWPAVVLSLFVLIGNPLIVMAIMGYMGYRKRTGFLAGLTVAQISEFSIIFVAMGISLGHVGNGALGLTTLVGLVTIALSTYMILYSHPLYERLAPWLGIFERRRPSRELAVAREYRVPDQPGIVVFGSAVTADTWHWRSRMPVCPCWAWISTRRWRETCGARACRCATATAWTLISGNPAPRWLGLGHQHAARHRIEPSALRCLKERRFSGKVARRARGKRRSDYGANRRSDCTRIRCAMR